MIKAASPQTLPLAELSRRSALRGVATKAKGAQMLQGAQELEDVLHRALAAMVW